MSDAIDNLRRPATTPAPGLDLDAVDAAERALRNRADGLLSEARVVRRERDAALAKLAEAKRLGLEACELAEEATASASEAPDCGEQVDDYRQRRAAIAAALEAL